MEERELNEFANEIQDTGIRKMFIFLIRGFSGVKEELKELKGSVDKLQTITIIKENGKPTEINFQRNKFFQHIYDRIYELECAERDRIKNTVTKLSEWSKVLIPLLVILGLILGLLGYTHLSEQIKTLTK